MFSTHKRGTGASFFAVHPGLPFIERETGVTRNLQALRKIHFQILFMWQEIHQGRCETHVLLSTSINYKRKHVSDQSTCLSSASAVICLWFIYELQKSTTIAFSRNSLYSFYSRNPPVKSPRAFGFPIVNTPPFLWNSSSKNPPPLPFGNPKSRPWYRYGYFLESPIAVNFTSIKESPLFSSHGHPFKCPVHRTVPIDFYLYKFLLNGHLVQGNNKHITKKDKHFNRIM